MKVFLLNLGCPKNHKDGEVLLASFIKNDFKYTSDPRKAELIIINTCAFIDDAKQESIAEILRFAEYKKSGVCKTLMVGGCLSQRYSKELLIELPEVDVFIGVSTYPLAYNAYLEFISKKKKTVIINKPGYIHCSHDYLNTISKTAYVPETGKYSAYVKISEGCSNSCTYCSIPSIRGTLVHRPIDSVINEIEFLVKSGVKEIILIAQDLTAKKNYLKELIRKLDTNKKARPAWLRLMYCNPWGVDNELIDLIAEKTWIVNYIDMPIQHISKNVLKRMGRRSNSELIIKNLELLKKAKITVRSTLMLGFPGETINDYKELKDLVLRRYFYSLGLFVYSAQEGTPASNMADTVPEDIAIERRNELDSIQFDITSSLNQGYIGKTFKALNCGKSEQKGFYKARLFCQAPEIDGLVLFKGELSQSPFIKIKITDTNGFDLFARIC